MEEALIELGQQWATAEQNSDMTYLGQLLTDDFVGVGPRGFMLSKEQWLARYESGGLQHESFVWDETRARIYGEAAVVTGRQTQTGTFQGHEINSQFRVTQVFVRHDNQWRLAALHLSPVVTIG
jgi:ketosteroid isomerase-like protein